MSNITGNDADNLLDGTAGNDTIAGLGGSDTLSGLGGNDFLNGEDGDDSVSGGNGNDTLRSGAGDDTILGGSGFDNIDAGNDDDSIVSGGGGDIIVGGNGADTIVGSPGHGDQADYTTHGVGVRVTVSGAGQNGGASDGDVLIDIFNIFGSPHADTIIGGSVSPTIDGWNGNDSIVAGSAALLAFGADGRDTLIGGEAGDSLDGGGGADALDGGNGADTLVGNPGGGDEARFATHPAGILVVLGSAQQPGSSSDGDVLIDIGHVVGSFFADTLQGSNGGDTLDGGGGGDVLMGGPGADLLIGRPGSQDFASYASLGGALQLALGAEGETVPGPDGDTLLDVFGVIGSAFDDTLQGNAGADGLSGDDGDDRLEPGAGINLVDGGDGTDLAVIAGARAEFRALQTGDGVMLLRVIGPVAYHSVHAVETLGFSDGEVPAGLPGTETVIGIDGQRVPTTDGLDFLVGGPLNDSMPGGGGNDVLLGLDGDDVVTGDEGNDLIADAGTGNDSLTGGVGFDVIFGFDGADTIDTGVEGDFVQAGGGADLVIGGDGIDSLFGEEGDDWILGGNDLDFVIGGPGADALDGGDGNDRVHVAVDDILAYGGAGIFDVLVPEEVSGGFGVFDLGSGDNQNVAGTGPLVLGFEAIDATIATGAVSVIGGSSGGRGNVLIGSFFDDTLTGSDATDIIIAGPGEDLIDISQGDDTATGGGDADLFIYANAAGAGLVRITDFGAGDQIATRVGGLAPAEIAGLFVQQGQDAVLLLAADRGIILTGVAVASLGHEDFIVI